VKNSSDYVSDFRYLRSHPLNGTFSRWIDDKLTLRMVLAPFNRRLPKHYFLYDKGRVHKLMDCPTHIAASTDGVVGALKEFGSLAVKPVAGTHGIGFTKLSYVEERYCIDESFVKEKDVHRWLNSLTGSLVLTEYIVCHAALRRIYPKTPNAIRLCVIVHDGCEPEIAGAFIRFGTSETGLVDNASAGGIYCGIELSGGRLFNPLMYRDDCAVRVQKHPDTNRPIEGEVPHWLNIREEVPEIARYLRPLRYMGIDLVATDDGFKVLEINSHQDLWAIQTFYPLLRTDSCRAFFRQVLERQSNRQDSARSRMCLAYAAAQSGKA